MCKYRIYSKIILIICILSHSIIGQVHALDQFASINDSCCVKRQENINPSKALNYPIFKQKTEAKKNASFSLIEENNTPLDIKIKEHTTGSKQYELSNHSNNVLTVVSDQKTPMPTGNATIYFKSDIKSLQDYYPFGSIIKERAWSLANYRYKYGGKEQSFELHNTEDAYDFGARLYDSRLGRWLSVDPLAHKNEATSPYAAMDNCPISKTDPDGKDAIITIKGNTITITTKIYIYGSDATQEKAKQIQNDINYLWDNEIIVDKETNALVKIGRTYTDENGKVYDVNFETIVEVYHKKKPPKLKMLFWATKGKNYIHTPKETGRSFILNNTGGTFYSNAGSFTHAHEFGHLLGLPDRYSDNPNGGSAIIHKGWENNIMANGSSVKQIDIDQILEYEVNKYNKFLKKGKNKSFDEKSDIYRKILRATKW